MACAGCGPNSICATIPTGAASSPRSAPIFPNSLQSEIESVSGPRAAPAASAARQGHPSGAQLDPIEVEETAALIDFVAVCRNYASELAINEVTMRTYSDLQHYVEQTDRKPGGIAAQRR